MEEEEAVAVLLVEGLDAGPGLAEQRLVVGHLGLGRIRPVGGGGEVDLAVVVAQEVHL